MPFRQTPEIALYPEDLAMLGRVLARHCVDLDCALDSEISEVAAGKLLWMFQSGESDERLLYNRLSADFNPFRKAS